jgi:hypothetical protein
MGAHPEDIVVSNELLVCAVGVGRRHPGSISFRQTTLGRFSCSSYIKGSFMLENQVDEGRIGMMPYKYMV